VDEGDEVRGRDDDAPENGPPMVFRDGQAAASPIAECKHPNPLYNPSLNLNQGLLKPKRATATSLEEGSKEEPVEGAAPPDKVVKLVVQHLWRYFPCPL
jgi:hypothetical protein